MNTRYASPYAGEVSGTVSEIQAGDKFREPGYPFSRLAVTVSAPRFNEGHQTADLARASAGSSLVAIEYTEMGAVGHLDWPTSKELP